MTRETYIVVVDNDRDVCVALSRVLRAGGLEARSHLSAEDYLSSNDTDPLCLLLDLHMEGMSGVDLLRILRKRGSKSAVIMLTGDDDAAHHTEAEELGCVAFLRKPVEGRGLLALVRALVHEAPG